VEWLEEEDNKWRCQKCIKLIAMHLTECHWCGTKIKKITAIRKKKPFPDIILRKV